MELLVFLAFVGAVVLIVRSRRQAAGVTFKPAGAFHPPRHLEGSPASRAAVLAMARREGVLLILHPAFLIGLILFLPLMTLIGLGLDSGAGVLSQDDGSLNLLLVPLGWAAILASNLCTLRSRRYGTDELLGGAVVPLGSRTAAHLVACLATLPVSVGFAAALVLLRRLEGWEGWPRIEVFVVGPLIVLGGAVLGVAVARWLPWAVFGWVAVVATFVLQVSYGEADARFRWLHFSSHGNDTSFNLPEFQLERHGWHLVYLVGATLLVAAVALLRSPPTGARVGLLGVSIALVALGIVAQVQPPTPAQAATIAGRLQDPTAHQDCEVVDGVTYCSWPRYASWREGWRGPVEGVLSVVPSQVVDRPGGFVVSQRPDLQVRSRIDPDLRSSIDPRLVFRREPVVHPTFGWAIPIWTMTDIEEDRDFSLAYATALVAVGLPDRPWWDEASETQAWATRKLHRDMPDDEIEMLADSLTTCAAGGEARTVLALWLAGRSTEKARRALDQASTDLVGAGYVDLLFEEHYDRTVPPALPSFGSLATGADVQTAKALLSLPDKRVEAVVRSRWNDLVDPEARPGLLFELLGEPVPESAKTPPSGRGGLIPPMARSADLAGSTTESP